MSPTSVLALVGLIVVAILYGTLIGVFKAEQDNTNSNVANALIELGENVTTVNATLSEEISEVLDLLTSVNGTLILDLLEAVSNLNTTLCTKIMTGDALLNATLTELVSERVYSINGVTANGTSGDLQLLANGTGIDVQVDPLTHSIYLENTGIVTVNSVPSLSGSNDLLVTGAGMIIINSYPLTSTIEVDGTALSTAISNLQMQVNHQQMDIATLNSTTVDLQTQINNLQMAGNMIAQDLNGTTIEFNMTLMTLIMDVMTLQSQVATLQSQVTALQAASVPPGTIAPFGGTMIPAGYLLCDGTEYLIASYPDLYTVIGTMYCAGPCTNLSVFAVPDLRGKVPAGQGGTAFSGAMGSTVGAETHTLTAAQMPIHSHSGTTNTDGSHVHQWAVKVSNDGDDPFSDGTPCFDGAGLEVNNLGNTKCGAPAGGGDPVWPWKYTFMNTATPDRSFGLFPPNSAVHAHAFATNAAGSGTAHNNIQPSLIVKYIIKT